MKYLFLIISLFFEIIGNAQINIHDYVNEADSTADTRIIDFSSKWTIFIPFITKSNELTIKNNITNHKILFAPNASTAMGIGVIHKKFGAFLAFGLSQSQSMIDKRGKTKRFDLQVNSYMKNMVIDAKIQTYRGFYQKNGKVDKNGSYPKAPNLSTYSVGASVLIYNNLDKFSNKAAYTRSEIQIKSAGSFNYGAYIDVDGAKDPNSFSSLNLSSELAEEFDFKSFNSGGLGIILGYSYTFVIQKFFFINLSASPKLGLRYLSYKRANELSSFRIIGSGGGIVRIAIGYEAKHVFYGLTAVTQSNTYSQKDYEIKPKTLSSKLFIGLRF